MSHDWPVRIHIVQQCSRSELHQEHYEMTSNMKRDQEKTLQPNIKHGIGSDESVALKKFDILYCIIYCLVSTG